MKTSVHLYITHFFLEREMFQTFKENSKQIFCFQLLFFENRTVYEILWKNIVQPDRPQMTIWHMRFACWVPKNTYTHNMQHLLFSSATIVARTGFSVMRALPVLFLHDHASHYTICCFLFQWS
jgi:hypothetical protein